MNQRGTTILACVAAVLGVLVLVAGLLLVRLNRTDTTRDSEPARTDAPDAQSVTELGFERLSSSAIRLTWEAPENCAPRQYRILRRSASGGDWERRGETDTCAYTDDLASSAPQQYLYRVDCVFGDGEDAALGRTIPASNVTVCIDPGHYLHSSELTGEELYGYGEGLFMLRLGLALRDVLRQDYGIAVTMTRETDDITLGGYTNGELDNAHLSLRGTFAEGADLFISLHTNANQDDVNGSPTCNQPVGINKTIVFVNRTALASETAMAQANAVGSRVTDVNEALGLSTAGRFEQRRADAIAAWSDAFNDSLDTPGTVCYRDGENHNDYYGVLRGAASVNVPGIIVEHGFHTVAAVRQAAMQGDLARRWAEADAAGIAEGWGFVKL